MVALGIAVDYARAEQEALVLELLCQRGLPRPECADAEDRRVAIGVRALAEVEANRVARRRERVAEGEPASRACGVAGDWHHRGGLFGGECFVVARDARALRGKV